jgi:ABC-type multidrug transport system fused ATPase/permease subunit
VALVGPSGSGKSTLAKMFLRLYDPDHGSVSFGHEDLRCCRTRDIRQRFGVVPQDPYFFQTSIRENLHIVCPNATEDRMRECCEMASIWGFVESLPEGLDTVIGEGGARLSGGQRQRLAIARAMLHSPDYFVFDEATSALDTVSERLVQDAFAHILPGRTAIFIAHRLSTVKDCDRIIVLDDGRIVQDGSFERLRSEPGLFQRMVESDDF